MAEFGFPGHSSAQAHGIAQAVELAAPSSWPLAHAGGSPAASTRKRSRSVEDDPSAGSGTLSDDCISSSSDARRYKASVIVGPPPSDATNPMERWLVGIDVHTAKSCQKALVVIMDQFSSYALHLSAVPCTSTKLDVTTIGTIADECFREALVEAPHMLPSGKRFSRLQSRPSTAYACNTPAIKDFFASIRRSWSSAQKRVSWESLRCYRSTWNIRASCPAGSSAPGAGGSPTFRFFHATDTAAAPLPGPPSSKPLWARWPLQAPKQSSASSVSLAAATTTPSSYFASQQQYQAATVASPGPRSCVSPTSNQLSVAQLRGERIDIAHIDDDDDDDDDEEEDDDGDMTGVPRGKGRRRTTQRQIGMELQGKPQQLHGPTLSWRALAAKRAGIMGVIKSTRLPTGKLLQSASLPPSSVAAASSATCAASSSSSSSSSSYSSSSSAASLAGAAGNASCRAVCTSSKTPPPAPVWPVCGSANSEAHISAASVATPCSFGSAGAGAWPARPWSTITTAASSTPVGALSPLVAVSDNGVGRQLQQRAFGKPQPSHSGTNSHHNHYQQQQQQQGHMGGWGGFA